MSRRKRSLLKNTGRPKIIKPPSPPVPIEVTDNYIEEVNVKDDIIEIPDLPISNKKSRIPKVMTFFWSGKHMSWMRYMTIYSFCKLNPTWKVILVISDPPKGINKPWREHNVQDFMFDVENDYYPLVKNIPNITIENWKLNNPIRNNDTDWNNVSPPHKCDFLEWETLCYRGGFFSDFDILFIKPMDQIYNQMIEHNIDTGIFYQTTRGMSSKFFSIGFMCSSVANPFFRDVYAHTFKSFDPLVYQSTGVFAIYSMLTQGRCTHNKAASASYMSNTDFLKLIIQKYPSLNVHNFPMDTVYPFNWMELNEIYVKDRSNDLPDNCIGIHWYGGAESSQVFNRSLNHLNYREFDNTFCKCVERLG